MGVFENLDGHKMRKLFGKPEVSKTLGFAAHSVMQAQIMFRATGYNGRVSMNPLYPTYKTIGTANVLKVSAGIKRVNSERDSLFRSLTRNPTPLG